MDEAVLTDTRTIEGKRYWLLGACLSILLLFALIPIYLNDTPTSFPIAQSVVIPEGSSVREIAAILEHGGYIRSPLYFRYLSSHLKLDSALEAGTYQFDTPLSPQEIIQSLANGDSRLEYTRFTFPEGYSVKNMHIHTKGWFTEDQSEALIEHEGYLFPETYHVSEYETPDELTQRMRDVFNTKLAPYAEQIEASGYTLPEVVILASILEREANDETSMRTVAGILENRLREDIPLQVDATLTYLLGKTSAELTIDDLALDSPYNTYMNRGLPPKPIANPGLMAIEAVLNPIDSGYLFYLTGNDGNFYYARTFDEHKRNKERYLR